MFRLPRCHVERHGLAGEGCRSHDPRVICHVRSKDGRHGTMATSRQVLEELGHSPEEIDRLIAEGVVSESWSEEYLPT